MPLRGVRSSSPNSVSGRIAAAAIAFSTERVSDATPSQIRPLCRRQIVVGNHTAISWPFAEPCPRWGQEEHLSKEAQQNDRRLHQQTAPYSPAIHRALSKTGSNLICE